MFFRIAFFLTCLITPFLTSCSQTSKVKNLSNHRALHSKPANKKVFSPLIVLDPGHGAFDIGAKSAHVEEKKLTLKTALLVKRYLTQKGYRVILTRSRDVFIPLKKRSSIANKTKSRLLVSLHYNAHTSSKPKGIEIYYYGKGAKWRVNASKKLAQIVLKHLIRRTKGLSRGVKKGNFHVIRETNMPAILIEGGFITNPRERKKLQDPKYLRQIARSIAEGIDRYFKP